SDLRETLLFSIGQKKKNNEDQQQNVDMLKCFAGKKLLLVEDNELNREIATQILVGCGFEIDIAENGREAVEKVSASSPGEYALVLMDIQMPVMDGYTATRHIRKLENAALARIPIVAMTANAFDEDKEAALASGMDGFLSKPINMKEVISTIYEILRDNQQ
ncbi:MAG: response regulator, partial [Christensenellales bacterium]